MLADDLLTTTCTTMQTLYRESGDRPWLADASTMAAR